MTASDSRESKSRLTKELTLRTCHRTPSPSPQCREPQLRRSCVEALPPVFAWFHFSTWRVPREGQALVRLRKGPDDL